MARVLGVVGSPRRNGNTQLLVQGILDGAMEAGAEADMIRLGDISVKECDGCHTCWKGKDCVKGDDMNPIYRKISESDILVFGTPVYWYGPTGLMKCFLDRFVFFNCPPNRPLVRGKRAILVVPFEETDEAVAHPLIAMFQRSFSYLEIDLYDKMLVSGLTRKGEVKEREGCIEKANELGRRSVKDLP
ncbi:flavodoxin family protein [Macellibacteroides fermentans]|uniref:flavodoxin family protein n=1 Tax=Macellibacteroides fermentans TaxID=879969 RepID=UPI00406C3E01